MMERDFDDSGNLIPFQPPVEWTHLEDNGGWYILPYYFSTNPFTGNTWMHLQDNCNVDVKRMPVEENVDGPFYICIRCNNDNDMNRVKAHILTKQLYRRDQVEVKFVNLKNLPDMKARILTAFELGKQMIKDNPDIISSNYILHAGKKSRWRSQGYRFDRLERNDINVEKLKRDATTSNECIRYDIVVITPRPLLRIRYHLFLKRNGNQMSFLTLNEAEVNAQEYIEHTPGPGFIPNNDKPVCSLNVEQDRDLIIRFKTKIYQRFPQQELNFHLNVLRTFYEGIEIVDGDGVNRMEIDYPMIPDGYLITYLRRKQQTTYSFLPNIFHLCEEKVFRNLDREDPQSNIVDVFFENENINQLLREEDWDAQNIANEMESLITFSNERFLTPYMDV